MFTRIKQLAIAGAFVVVMVLGGGMLRSTLAPAAAAVPHAPVIAQTCNGTQGPC